MEDADKKYQELSEEIEKIKFHNRTLLTLLGFINEEGMEKTTIYEAIVLFDLSKKDLKDLKMLILNYEDNNFALEQKALLINPILGRDNLMFIIKSFVNADMLVTQANKILQNYESKE